MPSSSKKRPLEEAAQQQKQKKPKLRAKDNEVAEKHVAADADFPRGGGSSFTPAEYKAIRTEAYKEVEDELRFEVRTRTREVLIYFS